MLEGFKLMTQRGAAAAGGGLDDSGGSVFVVGREGVVEVVEDRAAGDQEIPGLDAVGQVMDAAEAGLIVSDRPVQAEVHADGKRRRGVVEVEDRDCGIGPLDLGFVIGDVLSDQMFMGERFLGVGDDAGNQRLPLEGDAGEVGLVADLEVDVVKGVQLADGLADKGLLDLLDRLMFEGVDFFALDSRQAVGVVARRSWD